LPSPVEDIVTNCAAISDDDSVVFQFAVNIHNLRESLGMIMMMVLSTFLELLLHQIYKMRELARISFLMEIPRSMLLRELQYLLHPILV
jgi:hypothetical protein